MIPNSNPGHAHTNEHNEQGLNITFSTMNFCVFFTHCYLQISMNIDMIAFASRGS